MSFAEFTLQKQPVQLLQRSLQRGRLAHAYLFSGEDQEQLERLALTLAKTLNCRRNLNLPIAERLDSCDQCDNCRRIDAAQHPDVQWIRPESKSRVITIQQVRELMETVHLKAMEADYKVAIITAADRMNVQAANAFLKTLEEPPTQSILLLLTQEPQQILETILSRCLRLNLGGGAERPEPELLQWMSTFAQAALATQNGLLGRYRLLGLMQSRLAELRHRITEDLTARSPLQHYEEVENSLRDKWEDELTAAIEAEYRHQRSQLIAALEWWLRDIWLHTISAPTAPHYPELADHTQQAAQRLTPDQAVENVGVIERMARQLYTNVQETLAIEVGLLKLHF